MKFLVSDGFATTIEPMQDAQRDAFDAATKRQLRLELASRSGVGDTAAEIRKRLATMARSKSFIDWPKARAFSRDIEAQRAAIIKHVAPGQPAEAVDLLWRLLEMAPSLYERCNDSNGVIGDIMDRALEDPFVTPLTDST